MLIVVDSRIVESRIVESENMRKNDSSTQKKRQVIKIINSIRKKDHGQQPLILVESLCLAHFEVL